VFPDFYKTELNSLQDADTENETDFIAMAASKKGTQE